MCVSSCTSNGGIFSQFRHLKPKFMRSGESIHSAVVDANSKQAIISAVHRGGWMSANIRLVCCFLTFAGCLLPQGGESTEILGFVEDGSGSVVPGVEITATHVATGQARKTVTGDSGTYVFSFMQPGEYTLRA